MSDIRPISDLRNKFTEISQTVHEQNEPVILTRNGYGNMVVMSYEHYRNLQHEAGVAMSLQEAHQEAGSTSQRFSHEDVMDSLKGILNQAARDGKLQD